MRLADLDYELPAEAIAQTPVEPRDAARLLVDRGAYSVPEDRHVRDLPELLGAGDLVVVNDTRVLPARLRLRRASGGTAEVLLLEALDGGRTWSALVRPSRRLHDGEVLEGADGEPVVQLLGRDPVSATWRIHLTGESASVLARHGEVPLPPYITAPLADPDRYQTVYARRPGSVAAPTAGLHLTAGLIARLADRGITTAAVELVVGLDTFAPVTEEDPTRHRIHSEAYSVPEAVLEACARAHRVVAVGTTVVRALETAATGPPYGRTSLFIRRPFPWRVVDVLLTNFHLPRTSLLMMVDAFVGPRWRLLYELALARGYRFASFGDAMLLERARDDGR